MRILVVEDEQKIANSIKRGLETHSYAVDIAYDGENGLAMAITEPYDLIILDRMLPKMDGVKILEQIRSKNIQTPVLFLTAKDRVLDRTAGLNAGADDYLVKPFAFIELLARVRALLRRPATANNVKLKYDGVELDSSRSSVTRNGKNILLSKKEFALLEYFMNNPGRPLSKETLVDHVWNYDADILPNTVEVYVGYLRNKLDKPFKASSPLIHTRRGFGYVFSKNGAILDSRKARSSPDLSNPATNDLSSLDVSTDTSPSDKTVFARASSPRERTILRKSSKYVS